MSTIGNITFKITNTKLHVPIVTLSTKDDGNLTKKYKDSKDSKDSKGFKRSIYWNEYKSKIETKPANNQTSTRFTLDTSFQGVNRLFVLAFNNANNDDNRVQRSSRTKYFLPRVRITSYNVLIDGGNFYDQAISDEIRKYDEIGKITTGK